MSKGELVIFEEFAIAVNKFEIFMSIYKIISSLLNMFCYISPENHHLFDFKKGNKEEGEDVQKNKKKRRFIYLKKRTAKPRSAIQHNPFFLTRIFLDLMSL